MSTKIMFYIQLFSAANLTMRSINVGIVFERLGGLLRVNFLHLSLFPFLCCFIEQAITAALSRFQLDVLMNKITFMCDRGSNLIKALEDFEVVHCFPHRLNNILKRTFYSAGTAEKNERKKRRSAKKSRRDDQISFDINDEDPLMDYDDRDSSESEDDDDVVLDEKAVELALRNLSSSPERDHVNVLEEDLPAPAAQVLATIVRCKQLCCYVKRVITAIVLRRSIFQAKNSFCS